MFSCRADDHLLLLSRWCTCTITSSSKMVVHHCDHWCLISRVSYFIPHTSGAVPYIGNGIQCSVEGAVPVLYLETGDAWSINNMQLVNTLSSWLL